MLIGTYFYALCNRGQLNTRGNLNAGCPTCDPTRVGQYHVPRNTGSNRPLPLPLPLGERKRICVVNLTSMATSKKLAVLLIAFSLVLVGVRADAGIDGDVPQSDATDSTLTVELEQLKSKMSSLESVISDKTRELKSKADIITQMENIIQEKSASIISLEGEIKLLQKKGTVDAEVLVGKAHAQASEFQKQVGELNKEIETQTRTKNDLEFRASEAESKLSELNLKMKKLEKTNDKQRHIIQKTERALQVAEEELIRAQLEATSKAKELLEVHRSWLPPWLERLVCRCQGLVVTHWKEHGKPALDLLRKKASERTAAVQKWTEPHLETFKTKWIPAAKEQWVVFADYVRPHVDLLSTKTIETYATCRNSITPHIIKVQELANPYFQEAKKFTKPHIHKIATFTKPHVEKVRAVLRPYTEKAVYAYGVFLKSATKYHHQVQVAIHEKLEKHELTKTVATKELVWFLASALLALPILSLYKVFSAIFSKKSRKPTRNSHTSHAPRRSKRRHAEK